MARSPISKTDKQILSLMSSLGGTDLITVISISSFVKAKSSYIDLVINL